MTSKGLSLHVGLNAVDPAHYGGWSGPLTACEADARDMQALATSKGYATSELLTVAASRENVRKRIEVAATSLVAGDIFLLTYSGHGGQVPDSNDPEPDGMDETWCLFDGELLDDELYQLFTRFRQGVRVLVLSDSCHSGSVTRALALKGSSVRSIYESFDAVASGESLRYRDMPPEISLRTYEQNRTFYDGLQAKTPGQVESIHDLAASVRLISGCQDNQLSADGTFNGLFTAKLKRVWNGGKFKGSYADFHAAIVELMPPVQTPNHYVVGPPDSAFDAQVPFQI